MIKLRSNFSNNVYNTSKLNYSLSAKHFKISNLYEDHSVTTTSDLASKQKIKASPYTPPTVAKTTTNKFSFKRNDRTNDELSMQQRNEKFKANKEEDNADGIDWLKKLTSSSTSNDELSLQKRKENFKANKEEDNGDGIDWLKKLTSSSSSNDDFYKHRVDSDRQKMSHLFASQKKNLIEKLLAEKGDVISKHYVQKFSHYLTRASNFYELRSSIK